MNTRDVVRDAYDPYLHVVRALQEIDLPIGQTMSGEYVESRPDA